MRWRTSPAEKPRSRSGPRPEPPEILVGRRIADIAHAIYGSRAYLSRHEEKDLSAHDWIALDDALASTVIGRWIHENLRAAHITCRVDALPALRDAALAGLGLALLPCYLGDPAPGLRRLTPKDDDRAAVGALAAHP